MVECYVTFGRVNAPPDLYLFRGITCSKNSIKLRLQGGLSYIRMRDQLLEKLSVVGLDAKKINMVFIVVEPVGQLLQQMREYRTGYSKDMASGTMKMPKMSRIP